MREYLRQKHLYEAYVPDQTKPVDFDEFWKKALAQSKGVKLNVNRSPLKTAMKSVIAEKVTFHGTDGTLLAGVWVRPRHSAAGVPCLLRFHGYGGDRGSITQDAHWILQGYSVFSIDVRGHGESGDASPYAHGNNGSWVTQGILEPEHYYYRQVFIDGVRALDAVSEFPEVDASRIGLLGGSMGGGIVLGIAALDSRPKVVISDVPNLCDVGLAIYQKMEGSLQFVERFMARRPQHVEQVFQTLAYVDHVNLAERISARIRVSAAMRDFVCPPQTIFGMYNHLKTDKTIKVFPFSGHDAPGSPLHIEETIAFVKESLG
ncbi:acetylxylan esterase [Aureibacillus halotolerans]|uniref:acetylxylan esterase n=1 Tax=Aureibacillus halotolerans TaxID=1508390 RepID=UPI00141500BF|nr:acetylxylan esterase [Aureibacillus halotolerans]